MVGEKVEDIIIKMQSMMAQHELAIAELSDELYAQQKETEQLREQLRQVREQMRSLSAQAAEAPATIEPPPPHY